MKVILDSDVLLDFLAGREFDLAEIKVILDMGIKNKLKLYTSPLAIANIYYLLSKFENPKKAISKIKKLLVFIKILSIGEQEVLEE